MQLYLTWKYVPTVYVFVQVLQSVHGILCSLQLFLAVGGGHFPPHAAFHGCADQETTAEEIHAAGMG